MSAKTTTRALFAVAAMITALEAKAGDVSSSPAMAPNIARPEASAAHPMPMPEPFTSNGGSQQYQPTPDLPVMSLPMDMPPHPPAPGGPATADAVPTTIVPIPAVPPAFDHCQLMQAHFPDWESDPRMNAYLKTYCFG